VEHLLLDVHGDHGACFTDGLRELTSEEPGSASEIEDPVARFDIPSGKTIGTIKKSSKAGIEMSGSGGRKHLMVAGLLGFLTMD
jgi:hypothetical protein